MDEIKTRIDELMGNCAGEGYGPSATAAVINAEFGTEYSPRQVWNIWIDGDPQ